jgi:hypothetical protein
MSNPKCPDCGTEMVEVVGIKSAWECPDGCGEALSAFDAADIYMSNGCDADYSFGYTHEELIK